MSMNHPEPQLVRPLKVEGVPVRHDPRMVIDKWQRFPQKFDFSGPFRAIVAGSATGTGKSSLVETLVTKHDKYNHGAGKVIDIFACYSDDTEIFTEHGWKLFNKLTFEDKVLTKNNKGFQLFVKPSKIHDYNFNGELIHFGGKNYPFDLLVTPNHRVIVIQDYGKKQPKEKFVIAEKIYNKFTNEEIKDSSIKRELKIKFLNLSTTMTVSKSSVKKEMYSGKVYCVSVPPYEKVLVRRKGKVVWSGNSRDNENLTWCRHDKFKNNVLLLHGDSVKVSSEFDTLKITKLKLSDFEHYKAIISAPAFYGELREEWNAIDRVMRLLQKRVVWKKCWMVAIREGTSLVYSRLGIGENQAQAKAAFVYALREFRHMGCAVAIDILRFYGLDTEVRSLADYIFVKAHGIEGLPGGLNWLYSYYDLFVDIMQMPPFAFIGITKRGGICNGRFQEPYWHKHENENMLELLNIDVQYGDKINYGDKKKQTSDFEHADMMRVRIYNHTGMRKIAEGGDFDVDGERIKLRQRSGFTINNQINKHNRDIRAQGYCQICRRVDAREIMGRMA